MEQLELSPTLQSALAPFKDWALASTALRVKKRQSSTPEEIKAFYSAVLPHADAILTYLNQFPLDQIPESAKTAYYIVLSLAEVGPYVEWFAGKTTSRIAADSDSLLKLVDEPR